MFVSFDDCFVDFVVNEKKIDVPIANIKNVRNPLYRQLLLVLSLRDNEK